MTKFIDRNWAKWMESIAPIITTEEEEKKHMQGRRRTIKMNDEDPDEETKSAQ